MKLLKTVIIFMEVIVPIQVSAVDDTTSNDSYHPVLTEDILINKHESLKSCATYDLEPGEYEMLPNKTAVIAAYNLTYEEQFYVLVGDFLRICSPLVEEDPEETATAQSLGWPILEKIALVGTSMSLIFLFIHIAVFCKVPELRNLPGCNLASLCLSLFLSYLFMLVADIPNVAHNNVACTAVAVLTHFFFLGSFLWMFVISFDIFWSIRTATESLRATSKPFNLKKYLRNSLICWGIPLAFATAAIIADNTDGIHESYKPNFSYLSTCWFQSDLSFVAFFVGPVFTIISVNFALFGISAYTMFVNRMKAENSLNDTFLKKNYLPYLRLAIIMGATWIIGILAFFLQILVFWYLFAIFNCFQGLFIFFAFTCRNKIKNFLTRKQGSCNSDSSVPACNESSV